MAVRDIEAGTRRDRDTRIETDTHGERQEKHRIIAKPIHSMSKQTIKTKPRTETQQNIKVNKNKNNKNNNNNNVERRRGRQSQSNFIHI